VDWILGKLSENSVCLPGLRQVVRLLAVLERKTYFHTVQRECVKVCLY